MKDKHYKIIVCIFLIIGLIGTIFSFTMFFVGDKVEATVVHVQHNTHNTVVKYEYSYDGQKYTKEENYKKYKKIKQGETRTIYFFKNKPQKSYTIKTFLVFYYITILMLPIAIILFKR